MLTKKQIIQIKPEFHEFCGARAGAPRNSAAKSPQNPPPEKRKLQGNSFVPLQPA